MSGVTGNAGTLCVAKRTRPNEPVPRVTPTSKSSVDFAVIFGNWPPPTIFTTSPPVGEVISQLGQ